MASQGYVQLRTDARQGVNLFDLPELMRGAQPRSSAANRKAFQSRSVKLYRDSAANNDHCVTATSAHARVSLDLDDAVAMFPVLDAELVVNIFSDSPTTDAAVETLLALSTNVAEAVSVHASSESPWDVGLDDRILFPSLVDVEGWQIVHGGASVCHDDEKRGSLWCDRAKAAASQSVPPVHTATLANINRPRRRSQRNSASHGQAAEDLLQEDEYQCRHTMGEQRIQNRRQYARSHCPRTSVPEMHEV